MFVFLLFILAGLGIGTLVLAKRYREHKYSKKILGAISKGDERARRVYHEVLHFYTEGKYKFGFFLTKQLPLKAKIELGKLFHSTKRFGERKLGSLSSINNLRDAREIQKPDNISAYFKSMAETERGGALHDEFQVTYKRAEVAEFALEKLETPTTAPTPTEAKAPSKTPRVKKAAKAPTKRAPRKKKIQVIEEL